MHYEIVDDDFYYETISIKDYIFHSNSEELLKYNIHVLYIHIQISFVKDFSYNIRSLLSGSRGDLF
jgi:hypothetical protein